MDISRRNMFALPLALPVIATATPALAEGHDTVILDKPGRFRWLMYRELLPKVGHAEARDISIAWFANAVLTTEYAVATITFPYRFQKEWCAKNYGTEMQRVCREHYYCMTMVLDHGPTSHHVYYYEQPGRIEMINHEEDFGYARIGGRRAVFFDANRLTYDLEVGDRATLTWLENARMPVRAQSVRPLGM